MAEGTRNEALLALWKFIKLVGAQDRDDATRLLGVGGLERVGSPLLAKYQRIDEVDLLVV